MIQIWPGFGEAPVPTVVSMICKPDGVVTAFPVFWAEAMDGMKSMASSAMLETIKTLIFRITTNLAFVKTRGCLAQHTRRDHPVTPGFLIVSITERAAVLARIGAAGQRALLPVDPDRLAAAERRHDAGGLVPKLFEAVDDGCRHAVLELVDALIMQAARHIDRL